MKIIPNKKRREDDRSVMCSLVDGRKEDAHLHAEMLPAGHFASDEEAVRLLMKTGLDRADARRFISNSRGYG